jgi:hypothetical protein
MSRVLSVTDWQQYRSDNSNTPPPRVRPWERVKIPPLPLGLDETDPYAVTLYIIRLMQAVVKAGVKGTFWEVRDRGQTEVHCGLRGVKLPDGYQIKGLDETEIRLIASDDNFEPLYKESLLGNDDPA